LSATNTFTGPLTISGGTVITATINPIGVASPLGAGIATNTTTNAASLVLDGGGLQYTGGTVSTDRRFTLTNNGGTLDASGAGGITFTDTTAIALTGSGARTLTLQGTTAPPARWLEQLATRAGDQRHQDWRGLLGSEREQTPIRD